MTDDTAYQIIARGPRLIAEAAARAVDEDAVLESTTYSILEEDEDHDVWRIDAFPTTEQESAQYQAVLGGFEGLVVTCEKLADADWLAMALSGLPPVRAAAMARTPVPAPTSSTRPKRLDFKSWS